MSHTHRSLRLSQGQTHRVFAEAGLRLVAQHGCVTVTGVPQWLAGTVWRTQVIVPAGQVHVVDAAGWIDLSTGDAKAELLCVPAQAAQPATTSLHFVHALCALARRAFA